MHPHLGSEALTFPFAERLDDDLWEVTHWVARLSGGRVIYGGDIPGQTGPSNWERLGLYLHHSQQAIVSLHLKFRSHEEHFLPTHARGYFFRRRLDCVFGAERQIGYYLLGWLDDQEQVHLYHWMIPELQLFEQETRPANVCGLSLIRNPS